MILKNVFSPIRVGKMEIANRLVVAPMVTQYCNSDGTASDRWIAYHEAKAKGGWGLIITEDFAVDPLGRGFSCVPGLWDDAQIESHAELTRAVHRHDAKIMAQIYHAGRQTSWHVAGAQCVAPSPIACPAIQEMPLELSVPDIQRIVERFGDCALRAKKAGFDGVEIHGAHGYLLSSFMSLHSNKRTDMYGGCLMNRLRLPIEVIQNVRAKVGKDFAVGFRINGDELVVGGRTIEDTKAIAAILEENGVDVLHVTLGSYATPRFVGPAACPHGWIADYAAEVKKVVNIPVITVNRINDALLAETIISSGKADIVAMGRGSLADPALPAKAAAGAFSDITYCVGCMQGCAGELFKGNPIRCLVNPELGKEREFAAKRTSSKKKVLVAGGGPAGMEAAIAAAKAGHEVRLYERRDKLGGQYYLAAIPPTKGEISSFIACLRKRLDDLKVKVALNAELTPDLARSHKPDVLIIATGSRPVKPQIPGIDKPHVVTAYDVLDGRVDVGHRVVVIGGGMVGAETADHLANHGKEVIIVEQLPEIASDEQPVNRDILLEDLEKNNVEVYVNSAVREILDDGVIIATHDREEVRRVDSIVLAGGAQPEDGLAAGLKDSAIKVVTVGDALNVRNALEAVAEGYQAGFDV